MKCAVQVAKFSLLVMICGFMFSCNKNDPPPPEPVDPKGDSTNADTISNHLRFSNATKITGTIPKGPATSSLKISFKDTLYLVDKWKIPVKFLHEDTTKNLAGVYIQVHMGGSGGTFYYDVPEVPDIATNDTVSYILIGIDAIGLIDTAGVPPAGAPPFEITIVPHDPNGQPLGEVTVPVEISDPIADLTGECGLITKVGEYWNWSMSFIPDPNNPTGTDIFFNSPNKLWGLVGQSIQGCCTNGISDYTSNCLDINKRSLVFQTFFNWPNELYKFIEDGTYAGLTEFISADPDPDASNFCGSAAGVTHEDFDRSFLEGTWTVSPSLFLTTTGTSTPQVGSLAARPDGRIDLVSCRLLIVTQPDREGTNRDLVKFYTRQNSSSPEWHPL
jgi:hypothetical protein